MIKWVSFVSQTGSEIYKLSNLLIRDSFELTVVTNNPDKLQYQFDNIIIIPNKPSLDDYYNLNLQDYDLITLNGYLRIIPQEICEKFVLYNGHPGLINKYPELKGKDPQERAYIGKYREVGSVIHKVTKDVDDGEVLEFYSTSINSNNIEDYYEMLKTTSLICWLNFLIKNSFSSNF